MREGSERSQGFSLAVEDRVMEGLLNSVLPKVGDFVNTLDLSYSTSATSDMVST